MYRKLYQQCYPSTVSRTSNTKFLAPNAYVYYESRNEVASNIIFDPRFDNQEPQERSIRIPEDIKHDISRNNVLPDENELLKSQIIENYPINCKFCTKGGSEIPGVTWVGHNEKIIEEDIRRNPESCNYKDRKHFQVERYEDTAIQELPTSQWGPSMWNSIHSCCFAFPDNPSPEEKYQAYNFFNSLPGILPCRKCRSHCAENLEKLPPNLRSRNTLSHWSVDFHNEVNKMLGKPTVPYEEIEPKYKNIDACCGV
jgi:hypothetical protein